MGNRILLFLLFLFFCSVLHAEIEFFKEDLQFELNDGYFIVAGNYYFRNTTDRDIQATLFYPIPRDNMLGSYDSVEVKDSSQDSDSLVTVIKEKGFFFNIEISANSTAEYTISYRQKLLGNRARYIFTSTKSWGKPLERADFQLTFPKTLKIDFLSIIPDSLQESDDTYMLFWTKEDFMPEEDFVVHYHKKSYRELTNSFHNEPKEKSHYFYLRLTPYFIPGGAVGYTRRIQILEEGAIDFTLAANYHYYPEAHESYGLSLISEHFGNTQAKGIFFRANLGAEYIKFRNFDGDQKYSKKFFPNITAGLGYSIIIGDGSFLRLSSEIGYTIFIGRINCELLF